MGHPSATPGMVIRADATLSKLKQVTCKTTLQGKMSTPLRSQSSIIIINEMKSVLCTLLSSHLQSSVCVGNFRRFWRPNSKESALVF